MAVEESIWASRKQGHERRVQDAFLERSTMMADSAELDLVVPHYSVSSLSMLVLCLFCSARCVCLWVLAPVCVCVCVCVCARPQSVAVLGTVCSLTLSLGMHVAAKQPPGCGESRSISLRLFLLLSLFRCRSSFQKIQT